MDCRIEGHEVYDKMSVYPKNEFLLSMEEPVCITGHVNPDADVISTASALVNYFKYHGKYAYFYYKGSYPENMVWCFHPEDVRHGQDPEYGSLIIVDCLDEPLRLGFEPDSSKRVVVLDHHATSFHLADRDKYIIRDVPSTSSLLVEEFGILDPIQYVGIYYDALAFNARVAECANFIRELMIHNETITDYHRKLDSLKDIELLDVIREASTYREKVEEVTALVVEVSTPIHLVHDLVAFYKQFADILCLFSRGDRKVHFRSRLDSVDLAAFASRFGGGGHRRAAGMTLQEETSSLKLGLLFIQHIKESIHGKD